MCTHLHQRGSIYYFRRIVPSDIRSVVGKREWLVSLETKDRGEAKRLIPALTIETDTQTEKARALLGQRLAAGGAKLTGEPLPEWMREDDERWQAERAAKQARRDEMRSAVEFLRERLRGSTQQMPPELRAFAYLIEDETRPLRERLAAAERDQASLDVAAALGPPLTRRAPLTLSSVPLRPLFDQYSKRAGNRPATVKEARAVIEALIGFLGHDDARRISHADLLGWRDELASGKTRGKQLDVQTVRKRIGTVSAVLGYAVSEAILSENAAAKVRVVGKAKLRLREREFRTDEAHKILQASLAEAPRRMTRGHAAARRWIPWLCAYTGARVNELSQLRREDVIERNGIAALNITPEAGTVKTGIARVVPLPPHLIEQGFIQYVTSRADGPLFYDPTRQRVASDDTRHFKKVAERLAQWVRNEVGVDDPAIKSNHAWRHLFKTRAIEAGIEERVMDEIQGHAPASVARSYGSVTLDVKAKAIASMPRFDITPS